MGVQIKSAAEKLTEDLLESFIGKIVHIKENPLTFKRKDGTGSEVKNVWFYGIVAGFNKIVYGFNGVTNEFMPEYRIEYAMNLTDGTSLIVTDKTVIDEITEDELRDKIEETLKKNTARNVIKIPGRDF